MHVQWIPTGRVLGGMAGHKVLHQLPTGAHELQPLCQCILKLEATLHGTAGLGSPSYCGTLALAQLGSYRTSLIRGKVSGGLSVQEN